MRRYVITFTDHYSCFAFARATQSHASLAAREFFGMVAEVFPYPLQSMLTDNGSEFTKHFDEEFDEELKTTALKAVGSFPSKDG